MPIPTFTERYGSLSATGIAKETTFGTAVPPTTFLPMSSNTLEVDPGWFSPEVMMAVRDKQVFNLYGEAKYQGTIGGPLFPSNGIQLLVYAIGTDAVTGSTAPYTHTLTQSQGQLSSVTVEKNLGNFQSLRFAGCRIGKYQLKAATGNTAAEITADVVGQSAAILGTPAAVSVTNELPFVFAEASLTLFDNARAEVSSVEITIDNGLKETYTFSGNRGPSFITPVTVHVSGKIDLVWSSLNDPVYGDFTSMAGGTLGQLQVTLTHPGSGGSVQITCPQVVLSKYTNDVKMADVILSSLTFEASRQLPSTNTISAVVTNNVSTAY